MDGLVDRDLYGLVERVTRIETIVDQQAKTSAEFRAHTTASIESINTKLDAISADIKTAKSGLQLGWGLVAKMITPAGIGAGFTWLLTHLWAK